MHCLRQLHPGLSDTCESIEKARGRDLARRICIWWWCMAISHLN